MHTRGCFVALGLVVSLLGSGCGSSNSSTPENSQISGNVHVSGVAPPSTRGLPTIPVYFFVLTRTDGTGNEYFSREYARGVLEEIAKLSGNVVEVTLAGLERIPDDDYDNETQLQILVKYYREWPVTGFVAVFVSQPYTIDADGRSFQAGTQQNLAPFFTIRTRNLWRERCGCDGSFGAYARVGSVEDQKEVASMWLHELGHNMGLMHGGERNPSVPILTQYMVHPLTESGDFHTDNYYLVSPEFLARFAAKLQDSRTKTPGQG